MVFNTGMVGYPESLTDPSYLGQILMLTYPLIGNYGVPDRTKKINELQTHIESHKIQASALIVSQYSKEWSHWNGTQSLASWLIQEDIPALSNVDTRGLTQHLRSAGTMLAKVIIDGDTSWYQPADHHLVAEVSCTAPKTYGSGSRKVVLIDCGVKNQILHQLLAYDLCVEVVPWNYPISNIECDGIFISNGPGDPRHCVDTITHLQEEIKRQRKPIFGVCMGHQLLGLAAGASVFKLKYGHRSQNQPVIEKGTHRCLITSQNHGYAIDTNTLPKNWNCWFENLNDQTCAGLTHTSGLFKSVQFHPEAAPGPLDSRFLFSSFRKLVEECA
jgi:carbamoyl-phosphate synthase small subunit